MLLGQAANAQTEISTGAVLLAIGAAGIASLISGAFALVNNIWTKKLDARREAESRQAILATENTKWNREQLKHAYNAFSSAVTSGVPIDAKDVDRREDALTSLALVEPALELFALADQYIEACRAYLIVGENLGTAHRAAIISTRRTMLTAIYRHHHTAKPVPPN